MMFSTALVAKTLVLRGLHLQQHQLFVLGTSVSLLTHSRWYCEAHRLHLIDAQPSMVRLQWAHSIFVKYLKLTQIISDLLQICAQRCGFQGRYKKQWKQKWTDLQRRGYNEDKDLRPNKRLPKNLPINQLSW